MDTLALSKKCISVSFSSVWLLRKPLAGVLGNLLVTEAAKAVARELRTVQPGLVVANHARGHKHACKRVLDTELLDTCRHFGTARGVEQFVEPVEDNNRAPA